MFFGPTPLPTRDPRRSDRWRVGIFLFAAAFTVGLAYADEAVAPRWRHYKDRLVGLYDRGGEASARTGGDAVLPPPAPPIPRPEKKTDAPPPGAITAPSVIVKDTLSGAVLFGRAEYEPRPLASITKLMSALIILEGTPRWLATTTAASDEVFDTFVVPGEDYRTIDLWQAALVGSSNRAILSLADASGLARGEFVRRMNEKARELGLLDTSFAEPTGLDPANTSTASDTALLLSEALRHEEIVSALALKELTLQPASAQKRSAHLWNTNWLLLRWIPHAIPELKGGKTGFIPASGYNFAVQIGDGQGHALSLVILGAHTNEARFVEARELAKWALENFVWRAE
ncbi:MAG: Serine-type D-Ala-D-Ala carboxypeptidase [Candidatus Magasanikbacteria bacterium GW2011_GWA2_56_11]|uniref:Serine-type D-Ala-D-Ala carboxypeptidase n=1 Tax=Candidatus Magasanikbacteria bacterium GW2011_GWA2_56_11 TaxID=1619044 RepID=A0A0G2BA11_9BACT|nr:MAG: Serine-type D-Ala-D-Ala carboxypeptidase [Candidatus Magasanikbacteria bacterium GW2011_GWA2_56_11]